MDIRMTRRTQRTPAVRRLAQRYRVAAPTARRRKEPRLLDFWRRWAGPIFLLVLFAGGAHVVFGDHGFLAKHRMNKDVEKLQLEIQNLNLDNQRLSGQILDLKSDPRLIERIAREEMGLARPGELVFKLPENPEKK
jgi:cell division protein FtsB